MKGPSADAIKKRIKNTTSASVSGFPSIDAFKEIVKKQANLLKDPSDTLLEDTRTRFVIMANNCLSEVEQFPSLKCDLLNALKALLDELYKYAKGQIGEYFDQQAFPYCTKPLEDSVATNTNTTAKLGSSHTPSREEVDFKEMQAKVAIYEQDMKSNTKQRIPQIMGYAFQTQLCQQLTYRIDIVKAILGKNSTISQYLEEPLAIRVNRDKLLKEKETYVEARRILAEKY